MEVYDNKYTTEEIQKLNEQKFVIDKYSEKSFEEHKKLVEYYEQEMKRHEVEETAWSEHLYNEAKEKRDKILENTEYILFKTMEDTARDNLIK